MFLTLLCVHFFVQALSESPPAPPQNIHVDKWLLTWTPAPEERNVSFTVQYSSFDRNAWTDVPACAHISSNSCQVLFSKDEDEHGCVKLRVRAERNGLKSVPVEACSQHSDSCTPKFSLSAHHGTLTVLLSKNHSLAQDNGDHAKHRVYYGKEGEPLKSHVDDVSSVTIEGLQEGQRYCVRVQYIVYDTLAGLSSCVQCELVPPSGPKTTGIIVGVVTLLITVILIITMAYVLLFQHERIKQCVKPPCKIPRDFILEPFPERHRPVYISCPGEELCDVITSVTPKEVGE